MEASVAASGAAPRPKRRTLISVDCSSEYEESSSYRFGFQLGVDQLDGPHELRKTFPVPGGRPAYWGSGVPPGRPGSRSAAVTGRRPFARDAETEYEVDGALFDSGDEWEEEEEGENLDDSDADGDDEDERADRGEDEDDKEDSSFRTGTSPRRKTPRATTRFSPTPTTPRTPRTPRTRRSDSDSDRRNRDSDPNRDLRTTRGRSAIARAPS